MIINKKEIEKRLKEDKYFKSYDERYDYCFDVVETIIKQAMNINLIKTNEDFHKKLIIQTFTNIKNNLNFKL